MSQGSSAAGGTPDRALGGMLEPMNVELRMLNGKRKIERNNLSGFDIGILKTK